MTCAYCNDTHRIPRITGIHAKDAPCPFCTDSGTPDLDTTLGVRYSAGINKDGKLVRPLAECLNPNGTVKNKWGLAF